MSKIFRQIGHTMDLEKLLAPENETERRIIADGRFIEGAHYGKPRPGHPEGQIAYHIAEVLRNVDKYSDARNREQLRLIALVHDTFKYAVDQSKPKFGNNHHAVIARRFTERFTDDLEVLEIIELHDEAYNAYKIGARKGQWDKASQRALRLKQRLGRFIQLYLVFYRCDNETGNKSKDNFEWFRQQAEISV